MEITNSLSLTRAAAQQSMKNEVRLNAAYIEGDWVTIAASESVDEHALYDPNSGEVIAKTRLCRSAQVDSAAYAASRMQLGRKPASMSARVICRRLQIRWRSSLRSWLRCRY